MVELHLLRDVHGRTPGARVGFCLCVLDVPWCTLQPCLCSATLAAGGVGWHAGWHEECPAGKACCSAHACMAHHGACVEQPQTPSTVRAFSLHISQEDSDTCAAMATAHALLLNSIQSHTRLTISVCAGHKAVHPSGASSCLVLPSSRQGCAALSSIHQLLLMLLLVCRGSSHRLAHLATAAGGIHNVSSSRLV